MTAEIAILNSNAVALAADSAVTVGREGGKVYASADKLFQMTNDAPVGIMFYDQSTFLGVPWETIVKCYRSNLNKNFPNLKDYLIDFIRYLKNSKKMFPRKNQTKDVRGLIYGFMRSFLLEKFKDNVTLETDKNPQITEVQIKRIFSNLVKDEIKETRIFPKLKGMSNKVMNL